MQYPGGSRTGPAQYPGMSPYGHPSMQYMQSPYGMQMSGLGMQGSGGPGASSSSFTVEGASMQQVTFLTLAAQPS
jgi:hypothetical protein